MQRWFIWLAALVFMGMVAGGAAFRYMAGQVARNGVRGAWCPDISALTAENDSLRSQIAGLSATSSLLRADGAIIAHAYASYPFNNRLAADMDRGVAHGVRAGMPVTTLGGILVGNVMRAGANTSSVQLIGSPDWRVAVRVGPKKIPGLLTGGPSPSVGMIAADRAIRPDDAVIAADRSLPYGLMIGTISAVHEGEPGAAFQDASIDLPYNPRDLIEFSIMPWTPDS